MIQSDTLLLLVTDKDTLSEDVSICCICDYKKRNLCKQFVKCDKNYKIGYIVSSSDWTNNDYVVIYGEAVQVAMKERKVKYLDNENGIFCPIKKVNTSFKCVAKVYGDLVKWIN